MLKCWEFQRGTRWSFKLRGNGWEKFFFYQYSLYFENDTRYDQSYNGSRILLFSVTLCDPWPRFQRHDILNVEELENGTGQSYTYNVGPIISRKGVVKAWFRQWLEFASSVQLCHLLISYLLPLHPAGLLWMHGLGLFSLFVVVSFMQKLSCKKQVIHI